MWTRFALATGVVVLLAAAGLVAREAWTAEVWEKVPGETDLRSWRTDKEGPHDADWQQIRALGPEMFTSMNDCIEARRQSHAAAQRLAEAIAAYKTIEERMQGTPEPKMYRYTDSPFDSDAAVKACYKDAEQMMEAVK